MKYYKVRIEFISDTFTVLFVPTDSDVPKAVTAYCQDRGWLASEIQRFYIVDTVDIDPDGDLSPDDVFGN